MVWFFHGKCIFAGMVKTSSSANACPHNMANFCSLTAEIG